MRLEDKELEGPDLEREQGLETQQDETLENDKELPEHAGPEVVDAELAHRSRMFEALQSILAGENIAIPMLYLPQREAAALEALQAAVTGRDRSMNTFLFAEDRKSLLEQALSVLQQNLTRGDAETLAVLHARYDALTDSVAELRGELLDLEDAQDDLIEQKARDEEHASGDAPETEDVDESVTGFIASALNALAQVAQVEDSKPFRSTLEGPDLPEEQKPASTLDGPEVKLVDKATSLTGPELPAAKPHVSALDAAGPEVTKPDHVSALDGPEVVRNTKPSTLGVDVEDLIVPEHLRPRVAAHQPAGLRTDGAASKEIDPHVDDGGPAPPSTAAELKRAQDYEPPPPPASATARESSPQLPSVPATPADHPEPPTPKPAGRRGMSVRSSEKPGKKK